MARHITGIVEFPILLKNAEKKLYTKTNIIPENITVRYYLVIS